MTERQHFDFKTYVGLHGLALEEYIGPFLVMPICNETIAVCDALHAGIASLDEEHLVYAIELITPVRPLAGVQYLQHVNAAVFLAAFRSIRRISTESVSQEIIHAIESCPRANLFSINPRTGERVEIGSNADFLAELLATLSPSSSLATPPGRE